MKASDNPFPSILLPETVAPAAPATGSQRLFVDPADHLLKLIDHTGTVTPIGSGGGGGGGGGVGVGDYARWRRNGVKDSTSNTFDYAGDLAASSGTSIAVDSSTGWIAAWDSPAPVLAAGLYTITLGGFQSTFWYSGFGLFDATGSKFEPYPNVATTWEWNSVPDAGGTQKISGSATVLVPADTHIDLNHWPADANTNTWIDLIVQKVG